MRSKLLSAIVAFMLACTFVLLGCSGVRTMPYDDDDVDPDDLTLATEGDVCIDMDVFVMPDKLDYGYGELFSPKGLMFEAVYENGFEGDLNLTDTDLDGWAPAGPLSADVTEVTLMFKGCEYKVPVTVSDRKLLGIEVAALPMKLAYNIGDKLDLSGLRVRTVYEHGTNENETGYVIKDSSGKEFKDGAVLDYATLGLELTVSLVSGGTTKSDKFNIDVFAGMTLQAEKLAVGTLPVEEGYTLMKGGEVRKAGNYSGTGYVGGMKTGDILEFNVYSPREFLGADIAILAASAADSGSGSSDVVLSDVFDLFINNSRAPLSGAVVRGKPYVAGMTGAGRFTDWSEVSLGFANILTGYTKISLRCKSGNGLVNIDRLYVKTYTLDSLVISRKPDITDYTLGSKFSTQGLLADIIYDMGGYLGEPTRLDGNYTIKDWNGKVYENGTVLTEPGKKLLTLSYEYRGIYKSDVFFINVHDGTRVMATSVAAAGSEPADAGYTKLSGSYNLNSAKDCIDGIHTGAKIEYHVYSPVAINGADLVLTAAPTVADGTKMAALQFNRMFKVSSDDGSGVRDYFVGDGVDIVGKDIDPRVDREYMWTDNVIGKIDLKAGFTTITLECTGEVGGRAANIRSIEVVESDTPDLRNRTLERIELVSAPDYLYYGADSQFDRSGLSVTAVYSDITVEDTVNYIIKDGGGNRYYDGTSLGSSTADIPLTVEVTGGGVTRSESFTVHVNTRTITVEFEAFVDDGNYPTDRSYSKRSTTSIKVESSLDSSGGQSICYMEAGYWVELYAYSPVAIKNAKLYMRASTNDRYSGGTYDVAFDRLYKLSVDGVLIDTSAAILKGTTRPEGHTHDYFNWTDNEIGRIDLKAGFTCIKLDIYSKIIPVNGGDSTCCNLDKIDIYG